LLIRNATIAGNRGGGGTAGVWGESQDQLTVQNSIVAGNSDGAELTGFNGAGGSVNATYTDLCSGASPFAGTGNICADPALAGAGSGDVHETASSPSIDAGSNSLVPNGLTTDVYGASRIQPRVSGDPPIVDMGAAEFPSLPSPAPPPPPPPPRVAKLRLVPNRFIAAKKPTPLGPPTPKRATGTTIRFTLTSNALVRFWIRHVPRRRPSPSAPKFPYAFNRRLNAGARSVAFTGTLDHHTLLPGNYRLYARAIDEASGYRSPKVSAKFTVLRG
jgi:hypothetical protein